VAVALLVIALLALVGQAVVEQGKQGARVKPLLEPLIRVVEVVDMVETELLDKVEMVVLG
jgi:hypothetical protein